MGIFDALRDYSRWEKQADKSVPTPWKQKQIHKGNTAGNRQRLAFLQSELANPYNKTPDQLKYLTVEMDFFRRHSGI